MSRMKLLNNAKCEIYCETLTKSGGYDEGAGKKLTCHLHIAALDPSIPLANYDFGMGTMSYFFVSSLA